MALGLRRPGGDGERGFALVVVLWIVGLLAVLGATFSLSVRTRVRIAANVADSAQAEALADAGVALAILDLETTRSNRERRGRFPINGQGAGCSIGAEGSVFIQVRDEATRIDVNSAGVPLLQTLLAGVGEPPESAQSLAEAIFDFRDPDHERKPHGAERAEYLAAGLAWTPKNAPFNTVDELGQVLGVTPSLLERLRPYVTVYSGQSGVDAGGADRALLDLMRRGVEGTAGAFGSFPELDANHPLPAMFLVASRRRAFAVRVEAVTATGARYVREAVVGFASRRTPGHTFWSWRRGATNPVGAALAAPGSELPPC